MKKEQQEIRKKQIRMAAYDLLEKKGYKGTSMLAIAKQSKASNETLYSWYGNKQGLFRTLIEENAKETADAITGALEKQSTLNNALINIGILLLTLVTSKKAIALNRAAAADANETKVLGETLTNAGRNSITPLLEQLFINAQSRKEITFKDSADVVSTYLSLLLGDIQIRRVIGTLEPLTNATITSHSKKATNFFITLFKT